VAIADTRADAILDRTCTTTCYSFSEDRVKELRVDPLHFFEHGGGVYLFTRAEGHTDVRMHTVDRFWYVYMRGERYEYPKGFGPIRRLEGVFTIIDEDSPTRLVTWFSAEQA
jgi:hypothetical protein